MASSVAYISVVNQLVRQGHSLTTDNFSRALDFFIRVYRSFSIAVTGHTEKQVIYGWTDTCLQAHAYRLAKVFNTPTKRYCTHGVDISLTGIASIAIDVIYVATAGMILLTMN